MNQELLKRIPNEEPSDPYERIFWHLDKINLRRSCYWNPQHLEYGVRELGGLIEDLYLDWLRARGVKTREDEAAEYSYLVLPYISFRLLNSPASREVNIFRSSSEQKKRFLNHMMQEHHELPDNPFFRALMAESLKTFLMFLESVRLRREQ